MDTFDKDKEELLKHNPYRHTLFPIKYPDIYKMYKDALGAFWTADEIPYSKDLNDFHNKLNDKERTFLKNILAFFAGSDGIVNENLAINFYNELQIPEARNLYATQIQIEAIHSEVYSMFIETYITDHKEKELLFRSIETIPAVKKKAEWAMKWIDNGTFPERLLAFAIVEGIFFSGSFCAIYWLKSRKLMQDGLGLANELICRDEGLHCETAVLLYSKINQKLPQERVHELFMEAYLIEKEFITESLPVAVLGMNNTLMIQYIQFVIDYRLTQLKYSKLFNVTNPFDFMDYIYMENKTNFFEKRVSEYKKVLRTEENSKFSLSEDF